MELSKSAPIETAPTQDTILQLRHTAFCLILCLNYNDNKILVESKSNFVGLVGGGVDQGETPEDACIREIAEETEGEIQIDRDKLHFFRKIEFRTSKFFTDNQTWDGKKGSVFIYLSDSKRFAGIEANDSGIPHGKLSWYDLDEFFKINSDINQEEFERFCRNNNLPLKLSK